MTILDMTGVITGMTKLEGKRVFDRDYYEDIMKIKNTMHSLYNHAHLALTKSPVEFYAANPLFDAAISNMGKQYNSKFKTELFWALVNEAYIAGFPGELFYAIKSASNMPPNQMLASLDKSKLGKYFEKQISDSPTLLADVINIIYGYKVNWVTPVRPMVRNNGVVEIYIQNIDDILICNPNVMDIIKSVDDVTSLTYNPTKGIVLGKEEVPLRSLLSQYGITKSDLDLRSVE